MKLRTKAKKVPWLYFTCKIHTNHTTRTRVYLKSLVVECAYPDCDEVLATLQLKDSIPETEDQTLETN